MRVGIYVDNANIHQNGGQGMRLDVLREYACRGGAEAIRLNLYAAYDATRATTDIDYRKRANGFFSAVRDFEYKVITKTVKWFTDEEGNKVGKANADLDLAVDMLLQAENLDRVVLASGDGDFAQVVRAVQNKGCRVEVVACENVSRELRTEADSFMPGTLIPNLIPFDTANPKPWGDIGSRVRGICSSNNGGFGFVRFLRTINDKLWVTDQRKPGSPYGSAFLHFSSLPSSMQEAELPSRDIILEFDLVAASTPGKDPAATNVKVIARL